MIGLSLSNSATDTFKSGMPIGTWAAGLGGNSVKASTEHYMVMANILSDQLRPDDPATPEIDDPSDPLYPLDNQLKVLNYYTDGTPDPYVSDLIAASTLPGDDIFPPAADGQPAGDGVIDIRDILIPNESTVTENLAYTDDYSVTLKDDGKLLSRWGTMVKRPNDIRLYSSLDLPPEWYLWSCPTKDWVIV